MRNNPEKILAIWLCVVIFATSIFMAVNVNVSAYTTHGPIFINGNAVFTPANGVTGGSGTQSDPYIIEGWDISASSAKGIWICNTDTYFTIRDCYVHDGGGSYDGIYFYNVQNGRVENTILLNNWCGIRMSSSRNNDIFTNTANSNSYGIFLGHSNDNNIFTNTANSNAHTGVYLSASSNNNIFNNSVSNNGYGITLFKSDNNNIFNNSASNNGSGIYLDSSDYNTIYNNIANSNSYHGITLWESNNNNISNNSASNNGYGITLQYSSYNNIYNNTANSNNGYGILLHSSRYSTLVNNKLENDGIFVKSGEGYEIEHFNTHNIDTTNTANGKPIYYYKNQKDINIDGGSAGQIILVNCTNFTIKNVDCSNASIGIEFAYCSYCSIETSLFNNEEYGIYLVCSSYNNIYNNNASNNHGYHVGYGIYLDDSRYNNISNNSASNNTYGIHLWDSSNNNIFNNSANSNNNRGIYLYSSSDNNNIFNNSASNNDYGILLASSSDNNNIYNNTADSNNYGITLGGSNNNNIFNNSANSNNNYGIYLWRSNNNNISNNSANSNNWYGISLDYESNNNILSTNSVSNNVYGIFLWGSNNNNIFNNNFLNNYLGFVFSYSYINRVYHNNFIDNVYQGYDFGFNLWDDGYPSGGNYWSDYTGVDEKSGPNQNQPGSDGIGDTPYDILGGANIDRYPLMSPWGKPKGPEISVEKEFIPSEITTISQKVIYSINITNIGDVDITSMTIIDEYVENMAPNDPPEVLVTITSDEGDVYAIMSEDLNITSTENNITFSFELPLEVVPVFWENDTLQFGEEIYYLESIPKDWVVGIQYLLYPIAELEIGTYNADAIVTAYSETGASTTETATGMLTVSEPVEIE